VYFEKEEALLDPILDTDLPVVGENIDALETYQLLLDNLGRDLADIKDNKTHIIKIKKVKEYVIDFNKTFVLKLCTRSQIVKELYLLYHTSRALEKYNKEVAHFTYNKFRSSIYFPNILYLLVRFLPNAKKFLQKTIQQTYQEFKNRSQGLINVHVNSLYLDHDVIKTDVLYDFLGNGIKKFNPLDLGNIKSFYRVCFRSVFQYYFRRRRNLENQEIIEYNFNEDNLLYQNKISSRISIYKDVLYDIHIKKVQKKHTVLSQLSYNFQIFKNIITNNEFQNIYQNLKTPDSTIKNIEYQMINFFDDDLFLKNPGVVDQLKKLPLIYKLLRCAHIQGSRSIPYNDFLIKPNDVIFIIKEELSIPFKNFFIDPYVNDILDQIAKNFVKSVLSGEYINLITFSTVKINHISFVDQLRRFVKLCLDQPFINTGVLKDNAN
jgi:hypothetical protein